MPTALSHLAVPIAVGLGLGSGTVPGRLMAAGCAASILPDLDVIGFRLGIPYADAMGHRGFSHSLLLALLIGLVALAAARPLRATRSVAFGFVALCTLSHGLLDMMTDAGQGVAFAWPISDQRWFAPWRVIEAAPLRLARLLSPRGLEVLGSELRWVWIPALTLCSALWLSRVLARGVAAVKNRNS